MKLFDMIQETKCADGWKDNPRARCRDCFTRFDYSPYNMEGDVYNDRYVCPNCYNEKYGYCNGCGKFLPYSKMNDEIFCKRCAK